MGLRYYKRTKKSNGAWLNASLSRRGANGSMSLQSSDGRVTVNIGKNGRRRTTINFGNGFRYVKQYTPKKGKGFFNWLFSKKKDASKKIEKSSKESWANRLSNSLQKAADEHHANQKVQQSLSFEEKARIIAEKQAAKARAAQEARKRPVKYVTDEEAGFTTAQKRFMILTLFVVIFIIQKCSS